MTCKTSPTVSVENVRLEEWPYVEVSVVVEGAFPDVLKDEKLSDYLRAVCVLSIYDPSSGAMTISPEEALDDKVHWKFVDWYNRAETKNYLRAEKAFPTNDTVFELNIESLIDPTDDSETTKRNWSETYLSYFTYIQIDTQQMAEDFNITIADEYKGMAGDYETGVIMIGGVVVDADDRSFDVQDWRLPVEKEGCPDS